ncbi:hypothetical protein ACVIJ6_005937 [Bradyrhizobium sp. USDA 4369]
MHGLRSTDLMKSAHRSAADLSLFELNRVRHTFDRSLSLTYWSHFVSEI